MDFILQKFSPAFSQKTNLKNKSYNETDFLSWKRNKTQSLWRKLNGTRVLKLISQENRLWQSSGKFITFSISRRSRQSYKLPNILRCLFMKLFRVIGLTVDFKGRQSNLSTQARSLATLIRNFNKHNCLRCEPKSFSKVKSSRARRARSKFEPEKGGRRNLLRFRFLWTWTLEAFYGRRHVFAFYDNGNIFQSFQGFPN